MLDKIPSPTELFNISGKVAIVTGGASGLGLQMSTGLAEAGANLVIASRRFELCQQVSRRLKEKQNVDALAVELDVTKEEDVIELVKKAVAHYGRIDILINNVGGSIIKATTETSLEEWNQIMDLNLTSVFLSCRAVGSFMLEQKNGKIINIASMAAAKGFANLVPYTVSKAAVAMFTRSLALEWARYNINVNGIGPGYIPTSFTAPMLQDPKRREKLLSSVPLRRFGEPREIALLAVYLASPSMNIV